MSVDPTTSERFWELVCSFDREMRILFAMVISLLVVTVLAMLLYEQGTGAYVISIVNLLILGATATLVVYCLRRCT